MPFASWAWLLAATLLLLGLFATANAEKVVIELNNGNTIEGELVAENDQAVTILRSGIREPYPRSEIKEIRRQRELTIPEQFAQQAKARHMLVNVATTRPGQHAVLEGLRGADAAYYEAARDLIRDRVDTFTDALDTAGAEYSRPDGAFYVMAKFDDYPGTMANVERLIDEAGVAGMPGEGFGTAYDDWIRFALVTPRVDEAADRLAEFFA